MSETSFLGLIHNISLLLAAALLFDLVAGRSQKGKARIWQVPLGLLLGGGGIALMLTPWVYAPGIIFDTRSVLLGISGLFFGLIPTVIAMLMAASFRIYQGGTATWMGVSVIFTAGTIGILWRHLLHKPLDTIKGWQLYLFGLVIHIVMLGCAFVMPLKTALQVLAAITLPVLAIYPLGIFLLGLLMVNRLRRERIANDLVLANERMRSLVDILQHPIESVQEFLDFALDQAIHLTNSKIGYIYNYSEEHKQFDLITWSKVVMDECAVANPQTQRELDQTGIWGEAVRQRKPILLNHFEENHPLVRGQPDGHIKLDNFLTVPIFNGEQIVAVVGVANKEIDYDEADVLQLTLLMDGVWKAVERKRAEEELREAHDLMQKTYDLSPFTVGLAKLSGRVMVEINPAMEKMFGYTRTELIGKPITDIDLWEKAEERQHAFELLAQQGRLQDYDFSFKTKSGQIGQGVIFAEIIEQHGEKFILLNIIDVTERQRAEEAQRESEQKYRLLFDEMLNGFATYEIIYDPEGRPVDYRFLSVNPAFEKLTGLNSAEILGKTVLEVFPETESNWVEHFSQVALTGQPAQFEGYSRSSDKQFEVNAFKPEQGKFATLFNDISERKLVEKALRRQNEYLTALQETTFELLSPMDPHALLENIVRRAGLLMGTSSAYLDLVEPETGLLKPQVGIGALAESLKYQVQPGEGVAGIVWQTGQPLAVNDYDHWSGRIGSYTHGLLTSIIAVPLLYGGQVLGVLGLGHEFATQRTFEPGDVEILTQFGRLAAIAIENARLLSVVQKELAERKEKEAQLQANQVELQHLLTEADQSRRALFSLVQDQKIAEDKIRQLNLELEQRVQERTVQLEAVNKELEAFAYSVSHDLRAPLRALDGFSGALLLDCQNQLDEQGKHYLLRIQEATRRMGQLIEDLLNLSRVTRREMKRERVDLSPLAQQIAKELQDQVPERKIEFDISPNLYCQADHNLMRIALENLISNALKFSGKRAQAIIQVGSIEQSGERIFFVRDNGVGFNMEYADKLFTPFQRLHSAQEFPGTGIGLVTVQRIITRHGGRLWPEAAVGQGATFYFTLESQ